MQTFTVFALVLIVAASNTSAARFRPLPARQEAAQGYNYPKPEQPSNGGYQYPKPEQGLPEPEEPTSTPAPEEPTTEADDTTDIVEAEAEAISDARGDQIRAVPEKFVAIQQQAPFQRLVYYPVTNLVSARLQAQPIIEPQQYTFVPETTAGFAYSTQVFQQW